MPILFIPLVGFVIFIIAAGWGFNALSHRLGADVAIAIYFLVLALLSAVPIAWLRKRRRQSVTPEGRTLVSRTFSGVQSSVVVDVRDRAVSLTIEGRSRRYPISEIKECEVFERSDDARLVGVIFRTRDVANATWSVPLANIEQAQECVTLLAGLKA